jgi:hypothetical protein
MTRILPSPFLVASPADRKVGPLQKSGMVSSGRMPPPPKNPFPPKPLRRRPPGTPGAGRPGEKSKKPFANKPVGSKPVVKKPAVKKPFDRFQWEFYAGAILLILLAALPMAWYVKGLLLAVIAAMVSDFAWNSPVTMHLTRGRKLLRWGAAVVVLAMVGWISIRAQYQEDTKQRLREPMAQILAEGAQLQDACLSSNSGDAEEAATAWGGKTGQWLMDKLGSAEAGRFNNPTGEILPGNRYNPVQQRCWSYVSLRMIALKDIANEIEHQ